MDKNSNSYVIRFALVICVLCSAALALAYNILKPAQDANAEFDRQKNVLVAVGIYQEGTDVPRAELERIYRTQIEELVLVGEGGENPGTRPERVTVAEGVKPTDLGSIRDAAELRRKRPLFIAKDPAGATLGYVVPVSGKGLWSTLYGYLALDADAKTVRGITFYRHGETPGLGGEVENAQWQDSWRGKLITDPRTGELVSVTVKKGRVDPSIDRERIHYVDGLSGATITSAGVSRFIAQDLTWYRPYLQTIWQKQQ